MLPLGWGLTLLPLPLLAQCAHIALTVDRLAPESPEVGALAVAATPIVAVVVADPGLAMGPRQNTVAQGTCMVCAHEGGRGGMMATAPGENKGALTTW